jgi:hypothetical protein
MFEHDKNEQICKLLFVFYKYGSIPQKPHCSSAVLWIRKDINIALDKDFIATDFYITPLN